jgi:hypothetical protein
MYHELGFIPSALSVAQHYGACSKAGILTGFVFDRQDKEQRGDILDLGLAALITDTLMKTVEDRSRLATEVLSFAESEFSTHSKGVNRKN